MSLIDAYVMQLALNELASSLPGIITSQQMAGILAPLFGILAVWHFLCLGSWAISKVISKVFVAVVLEFPADLREMDWSWADSLDQVIVEEKADVHADAGEWCHINCEEALEMPEISEMDSTLALIAANTEALLQELRSLDTIGNPDRADAFFSLGFKDSDLPPGFYDDNDSNDWVDAQLYY